MKKNMNSYDKLIRLGIAVIIIILYYKQILAGTLGMIFLIVAFYLTLTNLISFCPLYKLLKLSTYKKDEKN